MAESRDIALEAAARCLTLANASPMSDTRDEAEEIAASLVTAANQIARGLLGGIPVTKAAQYAKFLTALVGQGLTVAVALYGAGNKWVAVAIAVASALGVYAVPNGKGPAEDQGKHEQRM